MLVTWANSYLLESVNGKTQKTYFIRAEETEWDYAPSGMYVLDIHSLNGSFQGLYEQYTTERC